MLTLSLSFFFSLRKSNHLFFGLSLASLARLSQKEKRAGLLGPSQFLYPQLFAPIRNVLIFLTEGNTNEIREKNSPDRKENHQRMGLRIKLRTQCWRLSTMKTNLANPPPRVERQLSALNNINQKSQAQKKMNYESHNTFAESVETILSSWRHHFQLVKDRYACPVC